MPSVIQFLCDACYATGESVEGDPCLIALGDAPALRIILCKRHHGDLLAPIEDLVGEYGVRADGKSSGKVTQSRPASETAALPHGMTALQAIDLLEAGRCIFSSTHGPYDDRARAMSHLRYSHGVTAEALGIGRRGMSAQEVRRFVEAEGGPLPPASMGAADGPVSVECDVCGRVLRNATALGTHRFRTHGIQGTSVDAVRRASRRETADADG